MKLLSLLAVFSMTYLHGQSAKSDWHYGPDAQQTMDFYPPQTKSEAPATTMVLVHGGGWMGGDKADMNFMLDSLRKRLPGYAFLNLNYRLLRPNLNPFPTQEQDVGLAIRTFLNDAGKLNISGSLVLFGVSAGAQLALLEAYKNDPDKHVKVVIDGFGPTNLSFSKASESQMNGMAKMMTGKEGEEGKKIMHDQSPVYFVSSSVPPTFILQGGKDYLVDPQQSRDLLAALQKAGVKSEMVFYPEEGHGWKNANLSDSFDKSIAFIHACGY